MKDGSFYGNRAQNQGGGIYNQSGTVKQEGGNFSANTAEIGSGVYQDGIYQMSGPAVVDEGNDVYLPAEKYIEVIRKLQSVPAARVTPDRYENGRMVVKVSYGNRTGSMEWERFLLTPQSRYCLRPGDYQERRAGTLKEAVTISSEYTVQYDKNTKAQVEQMPERLSNTGMRKHRFRNRFQNGWTYRFWDGMKIRRQKRDNISREKIFLLRKIRI